MGRPRKPPAFLVTATVRKSDKLAALPGDSARVGFFYVVLGEGKQQKLPGAFPSERHFRELAGRYARFTKDYLAVGILERAGALCERCARHWRFPTDSTALVVHDWHEHQYDPGKLLRDRADKGIPVVDPEPEDDGVFVEYSGSYSSDIRPDIRPEFVEYSAPNSAPNSHAHVARSRRGARVEHRTLNGEVEAEQDGKPEDPRAATAEATADPSWSPGALSSRR